MVFSVLLRLFHGSPVAQFHCHTWPPECRGSNWTRAINGSCLFRAPRYSASAVSASFLGGLGSGSLPSRGLLRCRCCRCRGPRPRPPHAHAHAPSATRSFSHLAPCKCAASSAIAIALALHLHPGGSTPTLCYPSTSKTRSVRSACTALHINTPPSSLPRLPTPHRSHPIIISVSLDLPRSRSFLRHSTSATLDDNNSNISSGSRRQDTTHIHNSASPQPSAFPHIHALFCPRASIPIETHLIRLAALLIDIVPRV